MLPQLIWYDHLRLDDQITCNEVIPDHIPTIYSQCQYGFIHTASQPRSHMHWLKELCTLLNSTTIDQQFPKQFSTKYEEQRSTICFLCWSLNCPLLANPLRPRTSSLRPLFPLMPCQWEHHSAIHRLSTWAVAKKPLHLASIHTSLSHALSPSFRVGCFSQVFLSRR